MFWHKSTNCMVQAWSPGGPGRALCRRWTWGGGGRLWEKHKEQGKSSLWKGKGVTVRQNLRQRLDRWDEVGGSRRGCTTVNSVNVAQFHYRSSVNFWLDNPLIPSILSWYISPDILHLIPKKQPWLSCTSSQASLFFSPLKSTCLVWLAPSLINSNRLHHFTWILMLLPVCWMCK